MSTREPEGRERKESGKAPTCDRGISSLQGVGCDKFSVRNREERADGDMEY